MERSRSPLSREFIGKAQRLVGEAHSCFTDADYGFCIQKSAEAVEFALKAALNTLGEEYERGHDVSDELVRLSPKFPLWFTAHLPRLAFASRVLTAITRYAKYGDENFGVSPHEFIEEVEAEAFLKIAEQVFGQCERLYRERLR